MFAGALVFVAQDAALGQQQRGGGNGHQPGDQHRQPPVEGSGQKDDGGRRHGAAQMAEKGVQAERLAHALAGDGRIEDGIIGRVEDAVADAGDSR